VLREERPLHRVRPACPQRLAEDAADSAHDVEVAPQRGSR
jgi:hypothetical protein